MAAVQVHLAGKVEEGERLWEQVAGLWSRAWSANSQALKLMQDAGLTRFCPARPQRWVIASFVQAAIEASPEIKAASSRRALAENILALPTS